MKFFVCLSAICLLAQLEFSHAQTPEIAKAEPVIPLVDIKSADNTIVVDLRYAGKNNFTGKPLYPPKTVALIRPEVASKLAYAQRFLRRIGWGLKIWDAYRPRTVQMELWRASRNNVYVADPDEGAGSLHGWGIAVDATLVDNLGGSVSMPTDYDDFTMAAFWKYQGSSEIVRHHLTVLQIAMREAGFYGLRSEWWHFAVANWKDFLPPEEAKRAEQAFDKGARKL